MIHDVVRGFWW